MALYHIDPRQAGTGAAPNVNVYESITAHGRRWFFSPFGVTEFCPHPASMQYFDEQSALRAAREAAGFGHVAETACHCDVATCRLWDTGAEADNECPHCAWPRDAHKDDAERGAIHPDLCLALALAGAIMTVLVLVARG